MKLPFIEAGEIVTTHGVRGEVKVLTWLDSPEDLCDYVRCRIDGRDYKIEKCRVQKTCNLIKLQGIDTVEAGQALRGKKLEIYRQDAPAGAIFAAELIGMQAFAEEKPIGKVTDVLDYPGNQVYVIRGEREYLVPAVKAFIRNLDLEQNRLDVVLLEGMESDAD